MRGGEFISLPCFSITLCFLWLGGKEKCHHLLLGISQQVLSLSLSLPNVLSLWKRVVIMLGYPEEEEEGKQGVCNPK